MCFYLSCAPRTGARGRGLSAAVARLRSRYISQPRQKPEDRVEQGRDQREAGRDQAEQVGAEQEAGERRPGRSRGRPPGRTAAGPGPPARPAAASRGRTSVRNTQEYGVCWTPRVAPIANTRGLGGEQHDARPVRARAAARRPGPTEVSAAASCGPRGSMPARGARRAVVVVDMSLLPKRCVGRRTHAGHARRDVRGAARSAHSTQRRAHAAVVHCAALGQHGREHGDHSRDAGARSPTIRVSSCETSIHDMDITPTPSAARTCSLRGAPVARVTSRPALSSTSVVGVRRMPRRADQLRGGARRRPRRARRPAPGRRRRRACGGSRGRARRTPRRTAAAWRARRARRRAARRRRGSRGWRPRGSSLALLAPRPPDRPRPPASCRGSGRRCSSR